jgi:hypothetical protein
LRGTRTAKQKDAERRSWKEIERYFVVEWEIIRAEEKGGNGGAIKKHDIDLSFQILK